ncbi:MAG: DUF4382 domain-containing protein [Candidatus Thermoplasmatota archaeon]|nr:DUF4382 domain-containing protein [Candidatus Thermoplasmatota archaeon]
MKGKLIAVAAVVLIAVASGGYAIASGMFSPAKGSAAVYIKDPPPANWSAIDVTITGISIHNSTSGWHFVQVPKSGISVDLVNVVVTPELLGSITLPPGHYQMIRLNLSGTVSGTYQGATYTIKLVSTTVFIAGQFTITKGSTTSITLDFDSAQSIHGSPSTGFTMTPVVGETVGK